MAKVIYSQDPNFNPDVLNRDKMSQVEYEEHLGTLQDVGTTPSEYIYDTEFSHSNQLLSITPNNFPYDLPIGQSHWLLWVKPELIEHRKNSYLGDSSEIGIIEALANHIAMVFPKNKIFAIWQNSPEKQSISDLTHFHFIILD